jgi:DNA-directed RNA polymerase specialized sigma24 family protein
LRTRQEIGADFRFRWRLGAPDRHYPARDIMSSDGSVTLWLERIQHGDAEAAQLLWQRYFQRLAGLARLRLRPSRGAADSAEDVALSAFASFFRGVERGKFPDLADRDNLWHLLVVLTFRKTSHVLRSHSSLKRGGARVSTGSDGLDQLADSEPSPALAAEFAEECRRLLGTLGDAGLESVALWKLEGYTNAEIAARLGCAPRSVERKLQLIRSIWEEESRRE